MCSVAGHRAREVSGSIPGSTAYSSRLCKAAAWQAVRRLRPCYRRMSCARRAPGPTGEAYAAALPGREEPEAVVQTQHSAALCVHQRARPCAQVLAQELAKAHLRHPNTTSAAGLAVRTRQCESGHAVPMAAHLIATSLRGDEKHRAALQALLHYKLLC